MRAGKSNCPADLGGGPQSCHFVSINARSRLTRRRPWTEQFFALQNDGTNGT